MPEEAANVNVTSALPDDIRESVAVADLKNFGTAPDLLLTFALKDHIAHTKRVDGILETAMGKVIEEARTVQSEEAVGVQKVIGSNLPEVLANLAASIASMNTMMQMVAGKLG